MTAGTKKSANITNIESSPITVLTKKSGSVVTQIDQVALATTNIDDIGDIVLMCKIPSNAVLTSVVLFNDALDSHETPTLAANVGLYYSSGSVISAACIASAITSLRAAVTTGTEVRFEAANITTLGQEAWELAGLSSDPNGQFYIGLTLTAAAATAAAGDVVMKIEYLQ